MVLNPGDVPPHRSVHFCPVWGAAVRGQGTAKERPRLCRFKSHRYTCIVFLDRIEQVTKIFSKMGICQKNIFYLMNMSSGWKKIYIYICMYICIHAWVMYINLHLSLSLYIYDSTYVYLQNKSVANTCKQFHLCDPKALHVYTYVAVYLCTCASIHPSIRSSIHQSFYIYNHTHMYNIT